MLDCIAWRWPGFPEPGRARGRRRGQLVLRIPAQKVDDSSAASGRRRSQCRNAAVKSYQMSFMPYCKPQQVCIRNLSIPLKSPAAWGNRGQQVDVIMPGHMTGLLEIGRQHMEGLADTQRSGRSARIGQQANTPRLSDRAGCPALPSSCQKPGPDNRMMFLARPHQRQQRIHIEQERRAYHSSSASSRRFVVRIGVSSGRTGR